LWILQIFGNDSNRHKTLLLQFLKLLNNFTFIWIDISEMNMNKDEDDVHEPAVILKSTVSEAVNRESSINSISVELIHQQVTRQSSRFEIDGCSLEIVRIIGKVANIPSVKSNCTSFYLSDLTKSSQSVNPIFCTMWQVNVDNYNKCVQLLKKQKVKLVGTLDFDGSQIVLNILSIQAITSDLDVKYYQLEVQLQSMQRKFMLQQLVQKATSIATNFNHPSQFGEFIHITIYCFVHYTLYTTERASKKARIEGTVTPPPMKPLQPSAILEGKMKNEKIGFVRASEMESSSRTNLFSASINKVEVLPVIKLEDDETAMFYFEKVWDMLCVVGRLLLTAVFLQVRDILKEHGSSQKCIGLSVTEIMFFLDKQRVQVPETDYTNVC
jgi:hypothetical protein